MSKFSNERLNDIYDKTDGHCHLCGKKVSFSNYNEPRKKGAWEVEHSVPKSKGGTDHLNNLFPACIDCNRSKSDRHTKTARAWHGRKAAPLSKEKKKSNRRKNTAAMGIAGVTLGGLVGGPVGAAVVGTLGALVGNGMNPDKE
ncbi:HNH endonuclease [bacterium]|nr:HNH endonuclease [bacterium]